MKKYIEERKQIKTEIKDLLEPDIFRYYSARLERIRGIIEANPKKELIIVDEIQKVTALLDPIHALMEENKNLQFILTGSSSRKLNRRELTCWPEEQWFEPCILSWLQN